MIPENLFLITDLAKVFYLANDLIQLEYVPET